MQLPVSLLEHSNSSMRCRFIWPSMDACPPIGPEYITDWKLQQATLWSGDWWLLFTETIRSLLIQSVAFGTQGHLGASMSQRCWLYCIFYKKKTKSFLNNYKISQIIVDQQFHYTTKMTSKKYFPNAINANPWKNFRQRQNCLHWWNFCSGKNFH